MNQVVRFDRKDYHSAMSRSVQDKLWFMGSIPSGPVAFADFGCADGSLLRAIHERRPDAELLGYDLSTDAIEAAIRRCPGGGYWTPHLAFFAARIRRCKEAGLTVVLVLSSVVHEVISQGTRWEDFWKTIRSLGADYVAIRDMGVEASAFSTPVEAGLELSLMRSDKLTDWLLYGVQECGQLASRAEMLHGLLKYQYADREREYAENYFALTVEQWHNLTGFGSGYSLRHFEHYSLPYHRQRWEQDFGVDIPDATHIKILLKRTA